MTKLLGRMRRFLKRRTKGRALILLYHRIADPASDPQLLSVSPGRFESHLAWMTRHCRPMPLRELAARLAENDVPDGSVSITFDDGYADNLLFGKPLLERFGIPATVFVTSNPAQSGQGFWWDKLEQVFLRPGTLPERVSIDIGGAAYESRVTPVMYEPQAFQRHKEWSVLSKKNPTGRHKIYRDIFEMLLSSAPDTIDKAVSDLSSWAGPIETEDGAPLNTAQLAQLATGDLVEIGAHTARHPRLSRLHRDDQAKEIIDSKMVMENILGRPIAAFSYPFGGLADYDAESIEIVRSAGFEYACTTSHSAIRTEVDLLRLPRVIVRNWDPTTFVRNIHTFWYA